MIIQAIVIAMFLFIGFMFLKAEHQTRKAKILILIILGFLLYFSIVSIFTSEQVDITSPRGIVQAAYLYFGWIGQTTSNLWNIGTDTIHLVGNAIKFNNTQEQPRR